MSDSELWAALDATWPAARQARCGGFLLRDGAGGGKRVSAATLEGALHARDLDAAETGMRARGAAPLFQVRAQQHDLDAELAARGYVMIDPVICLAGDLVELPDYDPDTAYPVWPPLALQRDTWAAAGIGPARLSVMERAATPKTSLLGRFGQRAAGVGFVACSGGIAALHALHVVPGIRRRGVARAMTACAGHWARAQGAHRLAVQVLTENAAALALYRGLGMVPVAGYHYRLKPLP